MLQNKSSKILFKIIPKYMSKYMSKQYMPKLFAENFARPQLGYFCPNQIIQQYMFDLSFYSVFYDSTYVSKDYTSLVCSRSLQQPLCSKEGKDRRATLYFQPRHLCESCFMSCKRNRLLSKAIRIGKLRADIFRDIFS